jgi:hypothetical protein
MNETIMLDKIEKKREEIIVAHEKDVIRTGRTNDFLRGCETMLSWMREEIKKDMNK